MTGNVLDASGNVVGSLDPLTGEVLNTVGAVVGTVTDFVDGTTVLDSAGNVSGSSTVPRATWWTPPAM